MATKTPSTKKQSMSIGTSAAPHALVASLLKALGKSAYLVGAHGEAGAGPNKRQELLIKLPPYGTVAYVSLVKGGSALYAVRTTIGLSITGAPRTVAREIVAKAKAAAANRR